MAKKKRIPFPKICVVRRVPPWIQWYYNQFCGSGESFASYVFGTNIAIIYLTQSHRWAIVHELLHWWAFRCGGRDHWLNHWLDDAGYSRRIRLIGF